MRFVSGVAIVAWLALLGLLGVHVFSAAFWGNWDQDRTGLAPGFWHSFQAGFRTLGWMYMLLTSILVVARIYVKSGKESIQRLDE